MGLTVGRKEGTADGRSEKVLGITDTDGAWETVGAIVIGADVTPPFGAGDIVGRGEIVGNTDVVGSLDGNTEGRTDGAVEILGFSVTVEGLILVVGSVLGIKLIEGALETVGSNVFTLVGTGLIVGRGLLDGDKLGASKIDGTVDGVFEGISVATICREGTMLGTGDMVGSGDTIVGSSVSSVEGGELVGWSDMVGSSVTSTGWSVSGNEGDRVGSSVTINSDGAADGGRVPDGGHGNT